MYGVHPKLNFPLPHVFPPPPFPLCINLREPTASAPRGATLGARIDRGISLLMPLRFVRQLRTQTAQSLVLSVKLDARFSRRLAARVPSANEQTTHSYILSPQPSIATTHGKSRTSNSCTASVPRSSYASTLEFSILLA